MSNLLDKLAFKTEPAAQHNNKSGFALVDIAALVFLVLCYQKRVSDNWAFGYGERVNVNTFG